MNKTMQQPNGPGPSLVEQAAFVNGNGTRLIGAPDSLRDKLNAIFADTDREDREGAHWWRGIETAARLNKVIGTASR